MEGSYTSQVFDAGAVVSWNNISWVSYVGEHTNLNLIVRSCNDSECSENNLITVNGESPQSLNVTDNQYFQYKFNFNADNVEYTPRLYNVTIDYSFPQTLDINDTELDEPSLVTDNSNEAVSSSTASNSTSEEDEEIEEEEELDTDSFDLSLLEIEDVPDLILDSGDSIEVSLNIENMALEPLGECIVHGEGVYSLWIPDQEVETLLPRKNTEVLITLSVPKDIDAKNYNVLGELVCWKASKSFSFNVEVVEKKLDVSLINVKKEKNALKISYSLTELSGKDQTVEVEFLLFDYDQKIAEIVETVSIDSNSNKDFETILTLGNLNSLEGSYNLLINVNSDIASGFLQEEILLGTTPKIGGFAIFINENKKDIFYIVVFGWIFFVLLVVIIKRIIKNRSYKKGIKVSRGVVRAKVK